jgi:type IV secretion system protein VirB5
MVTPDQDLQRRAVFTVFGMLHVKDPATARMNEFMGDDSPNSPFTRAKLVTVQADISTVLPVSSTSWQVDWQETTRDRDGSLVGKPVPWRATMEIYITPPGTNATQTDIQRNPLGLWVRDFNWQQR